jgi:hypothetical protein
MADAQGTQPGEWAVLVTHFPGHAAKPIGICLRDIGRDHLQVKLRPDWWPATTDELEAELWSCLADDIQQKAYEMGAGTYLDWFESTCSNVLQLSHRQAILFHEFSITLEDLYQKTIESGQSRRWTASASVKTTLISFRTYVLTLGRFASQRAARLTLQTHLPQCMVAGCALLGLFLFGVKSKPTMNIAAPTKSQGSAVVELPPISYHRGIPILELDDTDLSFSSAVPRSQRRNTESHRRKIFRPAPLLAKVPPPDAENIDAPPPKITLDSEPPKTVLFATSIPSAPKYRRSRIGRFLSTLATPFKNSNKPRAAALLD